MAVTNRDRVGRGLGLILEALAPFVDRHLGLDWLDKHQERERRSGRTGTVSDSDPRLLLRMINDEWRVFKDVLSPGERARSQEIRDHANKWAHDLGHSAFSDRETIRALDTMALLLHAVGAVPQAEQVEKLYAEQQQASMARAGRRAAKQQDALPAVEGMGLKPWREVIRPHPDVETGNFNAAQFAANLHQVAHGEAAGEYGDPVEFFGRTYLTEGLRDLLTRGVRRISGDPNAAPVINLQTNFGGGKTHSLLALYHVCSGQPLSAYPQEVQELLDGADLTALGGEVRRVTLVGNQLSASDGSSKPDGTHVRTLWGEIAWQLGGRPAYDSIASADRTSTSPGAALTELIAAYAPCLILIDEWVAYARELYQPDLVAGSFDTQFTFAQTLTEAVAAVSGALLVVSIPASERGDADPSAIEVGGPYGQLALQRLQNVVRRLAVPWRPASATESFEIVRRRLFEEPSPEARTDIGAVARRFTQFYGQHRAEFPSHTPEAGYEKRIRDAYPLHPELFDRLYEDWSTLERFQRTRGVLRLMSTVISALWQAGDPYPLIMPATVPLSDDRVLTEVTQYLEDSWKSIVDADVDGPDATPARVDRERSLFGQRAVTRRLARTVFMGSAATLRSAHKGIDQNRIWLGTAVPGDTLAHFSSALHTLADQATYLYSDASRYWYDTQASVARIAKDQADRLREQPEAVDAEIVGRLQPLRRHSRGDFAGVHSGPQTSADILDSDEARLVLLHPRYVHQNRSDASPAISFAREAFETRGSSQRRHRNMLVFLAPDDRRKEELDEAVREYLAWGHVVGRAKELDLSPNQLQQAQTRRNKADEVVGQRIGTSYIWVITPEQPNPAAPAGMRAIKAESQSAELVERVSDRLRREGALAAVHASRNIHHYLVGPLASRWRDGRISVGELWGLYTAYPYLPRLRDRSVLDDGVREVLSSVTWEIDGFALATGFDEDSGCFTGLAIPHRDTFDLITDAVLLVDAGAAGRQRREETYSREGSAGSEGAVTVVETGRGTYSVTPVEGADPETPPVRTRFFGVVDIDPERYAREFTRLQQEILPHLADVGPGSLRITVEIEADRPGGFGEDKIRTVTENARVLRFERADFETG